MRIAVVGADGQLGADLCPVLADQFHHDVIGLTHADLDVASIDSVSAALSPARPDVVVNTAAMHHVEKCEHEPERSFAVNAAGPRNLSMVCNDLGAVLVQISTDYIFDGLKRSPYLEEDLPVPLNVYGNTKLAGEHFVQSIASRYFLVRVSGLYGDHLCRAKGQNFVSLMLRLAGEREEVSVVDDEVLTPTWTLEIAHQLGELVSSDAENGIYHSTAEGQCSWYAFARKIFDVSESKVHLRRAQPGEFPAKVSRPLYSVLENAHLKRLSLNRMRPWDEALEAFLLKNRLR